MLKSLAAKSILTIAMAAGFSVTAQADCKEGGLYCSQNSHQTSQYVPFTSSASMSGPISLQGLGSNEFLSPTSCPVNVNGLESGQSVLGCYQVMKKQQSSVNYHYGAVQTVQIVHPVIYVRYPVPTPVYHVPVPVPTPLPMPRPMPGPFFGPNMCGGPMMPPPPPWAHRPCF